MSKQNVNHPTQLLIGAPDHLIDHVETMMQQHFCPEKGEGGCYCRQCQNIKNRQHPFIVTISPEKNYTVKDIEVIFDKTRFTLDNDQKFFFILEKVETLTPATANRLLKVLEEPPTGYHFLLLTSNLSSVLPTIQSRSLIITLTSTSDNKSDHPLLSYFYNQKTSDPLGFEQELRSTRLSDSQSTQLLSEMINHFSQQYKKALTNNNHQESDYLENVIQFLYKQLKKPPQSGSSDIFWKHVYLSFPRR